MKYIGLFDEKEDIVTKEKLEAVASRVSTNEDNIAMAESDIEGLQTTVGTLQTNVTNVQTALTSKQDTVVGGAFTWTITAATHGVTTPATVQLFEAASDEQVIANVAIAANGNVTITINGTGSLAAGTYRAVIIG